MRIVVPHDQLNRQTLQALIEDFVTRDGAVHGHAESTLQARVDAVGRQLESGKVVIVFDEDDESWTILPADRQADAVRPTGDEQNPPPTAD